jgi:hypothetical protein
MRDLLFFLIIGGLIALTVVVGVYLVTGVNLVAVVAG